MEFGGARKRDRGEAALNGNGGPKKFKNQESELNSTGVGSKSKPCTKFFSTSGCPFGEGCHFLHYVPGGYKAASQMINLGAPPAPPPVRNAAPPPPQFTDTSRPSAAKTRLCNKYNTAEGCRFGDKCHFAHGEWELGKPSLPSHEDPRSMGVGHMPGRMMMGGGPILGRMEPPPPAAAASFGLSSTAKISVDASLAGAIIGKGGVNSKQICRVTGAKLSIRDHETDTNLKNIELEGTFDQIKQASAMVHELLVNLRAGSGPLSKAPPRSSHSGGASNNFKTKICDNFTKGSCTFGDRCHFAHGAEELRKGPM